MVIVTMKGKDNLATQELEKNYERRLKPELEIYGIDIIKEQIGDTEVTFQINGSTPIGAFKKVTKVLDYRYKFEIEYVG